MIVTKTLKLIQKCQNSPETNTMYLLGNRVVIGRDTVATLTNGEIPQFKRLMGRCKVVSFKSSWIDYMKEGIEKVLFELNQTNYYKYEDRGWTFNEHKNSYIVDVFLDNYDIEQFIYFEIPKSEISKQELMRYADEE